MVTILDSVIIVGYVLLMLTVGSYFVQRQGSSETFFLADRTLGPFHVFGTTFSTFFGTGLVFTLASFGYRYGVGAFVLPGAAVIGFLLLARAAPRIKEMSDRQGAVTLPALLAQYWSNRTRALAAVVTVGLFTATLAANFLAAGTVLNALVGLPLDVGIVAFGVLVITYTALGGFQGVVWTDILQTGVILGSVVVLLPAFVFLVEWPALIDSLPASHLDPSSLPVQLLVAYLLVGVFAFFGSQDLFQRIYAARGGDEAQRGLLLFTGALVVMGITAVGLGIAARAVVPDTTAGTALVSLTRAVVPIGLVSIVLLGFLALANSDADSQLLTSTSNVTHDLVSVFGIELPPKKQVWIDRIGVLGIGASALLVAVTAPSLTALFNAVGSWFAILGFVVVATLFWQRTTDTAAFAGLAVGFVLPIGFVLTTGNLQAATVVGFVPTVVTVGAVSVLFDTDRSGYVVPQIFRS
ncbi:MAG: sodium:solute symporter family protein [Halobacteriales archaeon]|nr:sodium:solute symporter family protein [Halobacteriales archaeon]